MNNNLFFLNKNILPRNQPFKPNISKSINNSKLNINT